MEGNRHSDVGDPGLARPRPAVVFAGGDPIVAATVPDLPDDAYVIAADSGLDEAYRLGWAPHRVVGDLDSVSPPALARARAEGVDVDGHDPDKDHTDLDLALQAALETGTTRIVVVGGSGGRLSHLLGSALLLTHSRFTGADLAWHSDGATVRVLRSDTTVTVSGAAGDLVSLVPVGGDAAGITTTGLRWRLTAATLPLGSTRGISNEMTEPVATITAAKGPVLVIHERTP